MSEPTVAHQPAHHPYVDRLAAAGAAVEVPDLWDVQSWADAHVDVVHVHFGFEHLTVNELDRWLAAMSERGTAVVYTLHDLDNPHLAGQHHHHRLLASLVARADHVFTLTRSVATQARRVLALPRPVEVIAHHSLVTAAPASACSTHSHGPVYVHASTVRPNLDVDLVVEIANNIDGHRLDVHVRCGSSLSPSAIAAIVAAGGRVRSESRLTDAALVERIGRASVLALPYRWGSHSGLLELAKDVGTPALAPDVGGFVEQGAVELDRRDVSGSLARAMRGRAPIAAHQRRAELERILARHRAVYRMVRR